MFWRSQLPVAISVVTFPSSRTKKMLQSAFYSDIVFSDEIVINHLKQYGLFAESSIFCHWRNSRSSSIHSRCGKLIKLSAQKKRSSHLPSIIFVGFSFFTMLNKPIGSSKSIYLNHMPQYYTRCTSRQSASNKPSGRLHRKARHAD